MRSVLPLITLCCCFTLTGCKPNTGVPIRDPEPTGTNVQNYDPTPNPATTGSIRGTVQFTGTPPQRVPIDMSQDPACSLANQPNASEQVIVTKNRLANVFVYVKTAPRLEPSAEPVVIDQRGCRFQPHVVAVAEGGTVEFRNSDPTMHNVHTMSVQAGNRNVDVSQGPAAPPQRLTFTAPENMLPVRCNNHPWMNAFLNVAPNTFFSVTGTDGAFTIDGLPPGSYDLVFVHEKLGEQHLTVTIQPHTAIPVTITYPAR